ncbi:unnamed protein product [Paramecium sonneborni]|uniref:Protein kinase domain-containing protein n=1 Tax=Paramecium sonneborni TaxID=65129 RepID=A0A8S1KX52_9CILI|nr:unnamed protein product [Paramecium sonneborni]
MNQYSEKSLKAIDKLDQFYSFYGSNSFQPEMQSMNSSQIDFQDLLKILQGDKEFQEFNLEEQLKLNNLSFNDEQVVTIPISFESKIYSVSTDIFYNQQNICLKSYIKNDKGSPLYAFDKNKINIISFYALKQNDKLKNGNLSIDPLTGLFQFKTLIIISLFENISFSNYFVESLKFHIKDHQEVMKNQAPQILYLMNKISYKQLCHFNTTLFQNQQDNLNQLKEIFQKQFQNEMSDEEKQKYLDYPKPKSLPLLTKIEVQGNRENLLTNFKQEQIFAQGGYAEIRKVKLGYNIIENKQTFTRTLALKTDKEEKNQNKVEWELDILKKLSQINEKGIGEGYIATSYYDEKLEKCYFMEFYNNGSLDQFISSKSIVISLRTKLFILAGIINGVDFLHSARIAHLDLKLGNILIQKQLIPKICDFGEAKNFDELDQNKNNFSRTIPYAAPELYNDEKITPAYDIFSFGILMCNLIFEIFPFDYYPNDLSNLEQRYKDKTYKIKQTLTKQIKTGPKKIMKMILFLINYCLQPDPKLRPKPKWILSIIWKMINFIDSF